MEQLIILKAVILVQKLTFDCKINNTLLKLIIKSCFIRFNYKIKIKLHLHVSYLCYWRHTSINRHFFINRNYGGCGIDKGWLLVVDATVANHGACKYDKLPGMKYPYILYGPNNSVAHYEKTGTFSHISYCNFSVYVNQVHLVTFLIVISLYM
jgi:hypothetical protein